MLGNPGTGTSLACIESFAEHRMSHTSAVQRIKLPYKSQIALAMILLLEYILILYYLFG